MGANLLPPSVEEMITRICTERAQPPPDIEAREKLFTLGEQASLHIISIIYSAPEIRTFSGYIIFLFKNFSSDNVFLSPQEPPANFIGLD